MSQYPLFETLAVVDGNFRQIEFHQQRVNNAFKYYFNAIPQLHLDNILIPPSFKDGFFRCRIDYNSTTFKIGFFPYTPKKLTTFQCVFTENMDYRFKYSNRKRLDDLKNNHTDEIIIINNGYVSDCTIGNLLFLKNNNWYSSADYLLKGTQLHALLEKQAVELIKIDTNAIFNFEKIMMINALNPFDITRAIPITPDTIFR